MIGSVVVTENPVLTAVPSFSDNMVQGTPGAWMNNSLGFRTATLGGFWTAQFKIISGSNLERVQDYLLRGLGRDVKVFNHQGILVWEGFIFSMKMRVGGSTFEVSLRNLANRVWIRYTLSGNSVTLRSTKQNDTSSQARWGIKEKFLQGNKITSSAQADGIAQSVLDLTKDPNRVKASLAAGAVTNRSELEIKCRGYFRTLEWRAYEQTSTHGNQDADAQIQAIIDSVGQFISNTDLTDNPAQVTQEYDRDITAAQAILGIAQTGNTDNQKRYIVGVYEDRVLRYEKQREPR